MDEPTRRLAPPGRRMMLLETRALADIARMTVPLIGATLRPSPKRGAAHVIVLPGFGADDRATGPLRHFLDRRGFRAEGWGLGRNLAGLNLKHTREQLSPGWVLDPDRDYNGEGCVPFLADRVAERIRERHAASGEPVSLIGWSLGGLYAVAVAHRFPQWIRQVITLGTPFGDPRGTALYSVMGRLYDNEDSADEAALRRWVEHTYSGGRLRVPVLTLFSDDPDPTPDGMFKDGFETIVTPTE